VGVVRMQDASTAISKIEHDRRVSLCMWKPF
jgi:hypothetical protein